MEETRWEKIKTKESELIKIFGDGSSLFLELIQMRPSIAAYCKFNFVFDPIFEKLIEELLNCWEKLYKLQMN